LPACFGQSVIAGNPAGKDACAPRHFALPSRRAFHSFAVDFLDCSSRLLTRVCSLKAIFGVTRSKAKKSATHKQIIAAEASSLMNGHFRGQVSLTENDLIRLDAF